MIQLTLDEEQHVFDGRKIERSSLEEKHGNSVHTFEKITVPV